MRKFYVILLLIFVGLFAAINSRAEESFSRHLNSIGASQESAPLLAIQIIKAAEKYKLDAKLFAAIIAVESMFKAEAYNARSRDYGLAQVNHATAEAYKFNIDKLKNDTQYNLMAGAKILAYFKQRYAKSEPGAWYCRYNIGTAELKGKKLQQCLKYAELVDKYYY